MSRALIGRIATACGALVAAGVVVLSGSSGLASHTEAAPSVRTAAQHETGTPVNISAPAPQKYVALGSSYAAGPGGIESLSNRCLRSPDNYPNQVATALGMSLVDATCSGSTSDNILDRPQRFTPNSQIDAVTPETSLVTITTGGNDVGYIQRLIAMSCRNVAPEVAKEVAARTCNLGRPIPAEPGPERFAALEQKMIATVFAVRQRAPQARILLVDYPPAVVLGGPTCAKLPLSPTEIEATIRVFDALAMVTAAAAQISGAELITASVAGADHTVCSTDPWLRGFETPVPYHPNSAGKAAVAAMIINAVR
ncbi:SGNH/GDSL hydrolase family protein [Gordonia sp. NPDC003504]